MSPIARANAPLRCGIYIRVSTAMQRMEGWSLDAQKASLTAFAAARGWKVVGIYADEGKTARKRLRHRKEIFRLMEDVKNGLIDVILFRDLDRWSRSSADFFRLQETLDEHGVKWVSERQPNLTMETKEGRLQVSILLAVGQNEADACSDRIKYTNIHLRKNRRWTAGPATLPRGYTVDEAQRVVIDPEQEPKVRYLIDTFRRTGSVRATQRAFNEEFGESYHYNNVRTVLKSPMLCGEYREVEDFVETPYLSREEYQELQALMQKNVRNAKHFYIFSGLVKCGSCGASMVGTPTKKPTKMFYYYRCGYAAKESSCHNTLHINEEKMEKQLMPYIREAVAARIVEVKAVQQVKPKKPKKGNREAIERQLDKLEDLYITSSRMTKEKYEEKRDAILAKLIEDEPEPEQPSLVSLERIQTLFDSGIEAIYEEFTREERRTFWRGILSSVTVKDGQIVDVDFIE